MEILAFRKRNEPRMLNLTQQLFARQQDGDLGRGEAAAVDPVRHANELFRLSAGFHDYFVPLRRGVLLILKLTIFRSVQSADARIDCEADRSFRSGQLLRARRAGRVMNDASSMHRAALGVVEKTSGNSKNSGRSLDLIFPAVEEVGGMRWTTPVPHVLPPLYR